MKILAIDPGNEYSAFCTMKGDFKPIYFGKVRNEDLLAEIRSGKFSDCHGGVAIEMIASYGMAVGKTVFDTCVWVGIYTEALGQNPIYIYRKDEKMNICGNNAAKDSNIIQALIDRFAANTPNRGKGSKKEPGWFYGFKADIWQAYAVGVTFRDMYINGDREL